MYTSSAVAAPARSRPAVVTKGEPVRACLPAVARPGTRVPRRQFGGMASPGLRRPSDPPASAALATLHDVSLKLNCTLELAILDRHPLRLGS